MTGDSSALQLPNGPLIARIKTRLGEMTRSERRIGEHLALRPLDAAFLPAARLSELVGVSESSVLRFSKALGYANYPALQTEVQEEIRKRLTRVTPDRLEEAVSRGSSDSNPLQAAFDTDAYNLQITRQQVDPDEFEKCISVIAGARRVVTVGMRGAAPGAELLGYSLSMLRPSVTALTHQADMLIDHLIDVGPQDVVIGFAFSRQSVHTINAIDTARRASAQVVAITDDPIGPLATRADYVMLVAMQSEAFIQSYTAVVALAHALVAAVGKRLHRSAMERLTTIEASMDLNKVFYAD
ncbi:MAG TPA: MurR/RpiR family transcriptional regulator [Trueperaceae bacterium]|nr:MurR/RpiR family transcriptional regulator [Trueperaceae bacterium]